MRMYINCSAPLHDPVTVPCLILKSSDILGIVFAHVSWTSPELIIGPIDFAWAGG